MALNLDSYFKNSDNAHVPLVVNSLHPLLANRPAGIDSLSLGLAAVAPLPLIGICCQSFLESYSKSGNVAISIDSVIFSKI